MTVESQELMISEELNLGQEIAETVIPGNGKKIYIEEFYGSAAFTSNSVVRIVWDYGGNDEILWSIKGEGQMPFKINRTGDGSKKFALVCENGELGKLFMSAYAVVIVEV